MHRHGEVTQQSETIIEKENKEYYIMCFSQKWKTLIFIFKLTLSMYP